MHEPTYRQAMHEAWHLVWHHKVLWIFGLLSALVGQFGVGDFVGKLLFWGDQSVRPWFFLTYFGRLLGNWPHDLSGKVGLAWALVIVLALAIIMVVVAVRAQGALVAVTVDWYKKKRADKLGEAWHKSARHFWRLLGLNILQKAILGLLLVVLMMVVSWFSDAGAGGLVLIGLSFAAVLLAAFMASALLVYAIGFVVAENRDIFAAIAKGWRLLSEHILVSIELAILLFFLGWILLFAVLCCSFVAFLPAAFLWILGGILGSEAILWLGMTVGFLLFALLMLAAAALFNAFTVSAWIYCFMKMKHTGLVSRLVFGAEKLLRRG